MICCIFVSKDNTVQTLETFQNQTISYNHNDKKKNEGSERKAGLFPIAWMHPQCNRVEW